MAQIVAVSSFVARGHVGLRAMIPAFEAQGHDVVALPTVILSSHAGYAHVAGEPVKPMMMRLISDACTANGWLGDIDMVVTGYLPTPDHVSAAAKLISDIRRLAPDVRVVCDPVIGDVSKGLYVSEHTARAIGDQLLPQADLATPNAFELGWLTGKPAVDVETAVAACRTLGPRNVLATSIPFTRDQLATLHCTPAEAHFTTAPTRSRVPSGTGDLLTALFSGLIAAGTGADHALGLASRLLEKILDATGDATELNLGPLYCADQSGGPQKVWTVPA